MASAANTTGNSEQGIIAANLFPLDAPEFAVRFRNGAKIFRHVFRRITAADWKAYYASVIVEAATEDRSRAESIYQDTASFVLYQRAILRVDGYQTRDGRKPEELPTWPDCIPQHHRLFAIELLLKNYGAIAKDAFQIGPGNRVSFVIVRDESESSTVKKFFGVTHHFLQPTADHRRRFSCARSNFPTSAMAFVSLHDDLIDRVEGYAIGGAPIASEQLQGEMWMGLKLYAVSALFFSFGDCNPEPHRTRAVTLPADFLGMKTVPPVACAAPRGS